MTHRLIRTPLMLAILTAPQLAIRHLIVLSHVMIQQRSMDEIKKLEPNQHRGLVLFLC